MYKWNWTVPQANSTEKIKCKNKIKWKQKQKTPWSCSPVDAIPIIFKTCSLCKWSLSSYRIEPNRAHEVDYVFCCDRHFQMQYFKQSSEIKQGMDLWINKWMYLPIHQSFNIFTTIRWNDFCKCLPSMNSKTTIRAFVR